MQESDAFMIELEATPTTRIEEVESRGDLSIFEVNPLADGYGVTLGNALRRVLLNSLEGAAVTSVQVAGVFHASSTIDNVTEDGPQNVLTLHKLRLPPSPSLRCSDLLTPGGGSSWLSSTRVPVGDRETEPYGPGVQAKPSDGPPVLASQPTTAKRALPSA